MLSEISQTERLYITYMWNLKKKQFSAYNEKEADSHIQKADQWLLDQGEVRGANYWM